MGYKIGDHVALKRADAVTEDPSGYQVVQIDGDMVTLKKGHLVIKGVHRDDIMTPPAPKHHHEVVAP